MIALIAEGMHEKGIERLTAAGIYPVEQIDTFEHGKVEVIIVRSVFKIDEACFGIYPNVKIVAKLGTGLDNIDQLACKERGVRVLSVPSMNAISTAEFAVTQILNIKKNSFEIYDRVRLRDFRRARYSGHELLDMTAGVIGYGSVGKAIVERLEPFVSKVYIRDKHTEKDQEAGKRQFVTDQNQLLARSDVVILAVTLKGNEKMVDQAFLSAMKPGALLVNIARGGLIDEPALLAFLKRNPEARYYCDVMTEEPDYTKAPEVQAYTNPILELSNVVYTPHIASLTDECQRKIACTIAEAIVTHLPEHTQSQ